MTRSNAIRHEGTQYSLPQAVRPHKRRNSKLNNRSSKKALTKPQEDTAKQWLDQLDRLGQAPIAEMLRVCANSILRRHHTHPETRPLIVSKMWPYRYIRRLPEGYKSQKRKPKDPKRLLAEDVS